MYIKREDLIEGNTYTIHNHGYVYEVRDGVLMYYSPMTQAWRTSSIDRDFMFVLQKRKYNRMSFDFKGLDNSSKS